jgi:hypothetical protein
VLKGSVKGDRLSLLVDTQTRSYTVETSAYIGPVTTNPNQNESTASRSSQESSTEPTVKLAVEKPGTSTAQLRAQVDQPDSAANSAMVLFSSEPNGADIDVDGKFLGNTPSQIQLVVGNHSIRIEAKGHTPWSREVSLAAGGKISIHAVLDAAHQD